MRLYEYIIISLPPDVDAKQVDFLRQFENVRAIVNSDWTHGRHKAVLPMLETKAAFIHYCDLDRLLHWIETNPAELEAVVSSIPQYDYLILGRTDDAWATHPRSFFETEALFNQMFSHFFRQPVDVGGGSRGISRQAVEFLQAHSPPGRSVGTDGEWPVLLQRAGFTVDYRAADGLDWETPDQFQPRAVDRETQRLAALEYDKDPKNWQLRVWVAQEIISAGLAAMYRKMDDIKIEKKAGI
jgi:hypothetical protein